jgi:hypothetical protein
MSSPGKVLPLIALLVLGCTTDGNRYVEGNSLALGLFVPSGSGYVGVQAATWLSGCRIDSPTNLPLKVSREFTSSNDYLGVVHVRENVKTTIQVK